VGSQQEPVSLLRSSLCNITREGVKKDCICRVTASKFGTSPGNSVLSVMDHDFWLYVCCVAALFGGRQAKALILHLVKKGLLPLI
jgi:hypothetical protein